jgi:hypothetical protein
MIAWASLALAVFHLIASILDDRRATRPQRDRAQREKEMQDDLDRTNQAIVHGDAAALAQAFERERLAGATRLVDGNGRLGRIVRLRGDGAADSGKPHP